MAQAWQNRIVRYSDEAPDQLLANPANWRTHSGQQAEALRGILGDVGIVQNVIANVQTGYLIDGHLRVMEAMRAGQSTIPVTWVDLSPDEEALILATLDPLSALAGTDAAKLDELLREISTDSPAVQALLDSLAQDAGIVPGLAAPGAGGDEFDTTPVEGPTRTAVGDLWLLGKHRLLVGDCTDAANVARLMDGKRAATMVTSPPYWTGQDYDDKPGTGQVIDFMSRVVAAWTDAVLRRIQIQTGHTNSTLIGDSGNFRKVLLDALWADAWAATGWLLRHRRVWAKRGGHMSSPPVSDLIDESWEVILTFYRPGRNGGGREMVDISWAQHAIWGDITGTGGDVGHPCPFPVEIATRMIFLYSAISDLVVDPFLGSGTTLIAAERTGRTCYGCEIAPQYADVILRRWEVETGQQAQKAEAA